MSTKSLPPVVFIHGWKASVLADKNTGKDEFSYTLGVVSGMAKDPKLELPMEWDSDGNQVKECRRSKIECSDMENTSTYIE